MNECLHTYVPAWKAADRPLLGPNGDVEMKRFFRIKGEAEDYSGESRSTLYEANKNGDLVFTKLGYSTRIEKSDLDKYLDRKSVKVLCGSVVAEAAREAA